MFLDNGTQDQIISLATHYLTFFTAEDAEFRRERKNPLRFPLGFSALSAVKKSSQLPNMLGTESLAIH
jgi:hypothetical protein